MKLSFRKKIFLSYLIIFLIFTLLLYPFVTRLVSRIHERNLRHQVEGLIRELKLAKNFQELYAILDAKQKFLFFRITFYEPGKGYLFDTHLNIEGGLRQAEYTPVEISEALRRGEGYIVRYSSLFSQQMAYIALPFHFENKEYVIRAAFPYGQMQKLSTELTFAFLFFMIFLLLLFSLLSWFIIHHLSQPVVQIMEAIRPFQEGKQEYLPVIHFTKKDHEFASLAETLNALSQKVRLQIETLTREKNEKGAILDSLIEGVVSLDRNMKMTFMNQMAVIFLGVEKKECLGASFKKVGQPECEALIYEAQKEGRVIQKTLQPIRGQKRFFDLVAAPFGQEEGVILVLQDKTELHRWMEMRQDFVANASHELKTPITIVRGFAETLHDHPELSAEVYHEITKKIVSNCERMETLIKNLLTLAAVDEGIPESRLEAQDVLKIIDSAIQTTKAIHQVAEISLEKRGEPPFILKLDKELFLQALLNLLDNAAKYSEPPAVITVRVIKEKKRWVFEVEDLGIGIPHDELDRIFERFYAVDKSHSREMGGSGLGLAITQRIIEKHKGHIEVQSELGKGSLFRIILPA